MAQTDAVGRKARVVSSEARRLRRVETPMHEANSSRRGLLLASTSLTFTYSFLVQAWEMPTNAVTFSVVAYGASGGDFSRSYGYYYGGYGGRISVSDIPASAFLGETMYIIVGRQGGFDSSPGLGGGGSCNDYSGSCYYKDYASGGGATELRFSVNSLSSRY